MIEVKGKGCRWDEDEAVELSRAQMRKAFDADGGKTAEAWYLYVVEKVDDGSCRVLPVENPARTAAGWILSGRSWCMAAQDPKVIRDTGAGPGSVTA